MTPGADQLHERAYGTEGTVDRLEQLVSSFRDRLREAVGNLGPTLDRARETLNKVRLGGDARHLMERRPATALAAAAVIGALIGLGLASRR